MRNSAAAVELLHPSRGGPTPGASSARAVFVAALVFKPVIATIDVITGNRIIMNFLLAGPLALAAYGAPPGGADRRRAGEHPVPLGDAGILLGVNADGLA